MSWIHNLTAAALLCPALASAQTAPVPEEEPPPPPVVIKHIPPRFSWELAISPSYGMLPQFLATSAWVGLGMRGGWGKHFGPHRVGAGLSITLEGALGVQWANNFEPMVMYDWIQKKGLWIGVSAGPDFIVNTELAETRGLDSSFMAAPFLAARIGYSQPWSLMFRRFFVGIEPKFRLVDGQPAGIVSIVIGSGGGY
jgi:hypothetical protein